jgi:hypothetical protein
MSELFPPGYGDGTCLARTHTDFIDKVDPLLESLDQRVTTLEQGWPAFAITSFVPAHTEREVGQSEISPGFTAAYAQAPSSTEVVDDQGNDPLDVSATPTAFVYPNTYTKTANNAMVDFTLSAALLALTATRHASITWKPRAFWGVGAAGIVDQAGIEALPSNGLKPSRENSFTVDAGADEYIYYAFPAVYGAARFFVGGWEGGFDLIDDAVSVTRNGVTQDYRLYRSHNANLGVLDIEVR